MNIRDRYKKLNLWNKIAFWGSLSSIIAFVFTVIFLIFPPKAEVDVSWPEVLNQLKEVEQKSRGDAFMSRTFYIVREPGASITLGNCPSQQCMKFTLGRLYQESGIFIQEIILSGDGFGLKKNSNGKIMLQMDNAIKLRGASLSIPLNGGPMVIQFGLHKKSEFEMFTPFADLKFTVIDLNVGSLRIRLDAKPPSGFSLN